MSRTVVFLSSKQAQCGVHEFGRRIGEVLPTSRKYDFRYVECGGPDDYAAALAQHRPDVVIYNHHPSTLPWVDARLLRRSPQLLHLGILHEVTQEIADRADNHVFDFYIAPDPTLLLRNPLVFKTGRLVARYRNEEQLGDVPVIGSFGFATNGKGFKRLVELVQSQFERARVRLRIPFAAFGDADGARARAVADACRAALTNRNIELEIAHEYLSTDELLRFLAGNSLNAFLYEEQHGRGIASVTDYALGVGRPIAVSNSMMFRHLWNVRPSVNAEREPLPRILERGVAPLAPLVEDWTAENLVWDYERIVDAAWQKSARMRNRSWVVNKAALAETYVPMRVRSAVAVAVHHTGVAVQRTTRHAPWLTLPLRAVRAVISTGRNGSAAAGRDWVPVAAATTTARPPAETPAPPPYTPIAAFDGRYNRILDDDARRRYHPAIDYLFAAAPELMTRKIAEANVQQAFVLDTVARLVADRPRPLLMSVGSYEDTATAALIASGHRVDEIDPVLNYDVATYMTKPTCKRGQYDAVFATSVIEHVVDDEQFLAAMEELLAPGGVGVVTCDFNDAWKKGDALPSEDRRFYTVADLRRRMLPLLTRSELIGEPDWSGHAPDFTYGGCRYSFASFVFRRVR